MFKKLKRLINLPPEIALKKLYDSLISKKINQTNKTQTLTNSSYSEIPEWLNHLNYSYIQLPDNEKLLQFENQLNNLSEKILNHEFELLGSGWVKVYHGLKPIGFETIVYNDDNHKCDEYWLSNHINKLNIEESQKIIKLITNNKYELIDWQLDFKSGFRWSEQTWHKEIKYGDKPGADIKVPWELGRMQHLPILALAVQLAKFRKDNSKERILIDEFCNQIYDFIACNPPEFGVQWACAMDVFIRAVNWLLAYDIIKNTGVNLTPEFEFYFRRSICEHGKYVVKNLEWSSGMRGNHYLTNVCGLLWISAYLPVSDETSKWLAFALQELSNEIIYQFYQDGGNFEASTSYHIFTSDMIFQTLAIIENLPKEKVNNLIFNSSIENKYHNKIKNLSSQHFRIDNGRIVFNKIINDRIQAINLFNSTLKNSEHQVPQIGDNDSGKFINLDKSLITFKNDSKKFALIINDKNNSIIKFPDFGLYVYNNNVYSCYFSCGQIGQYGRGGHAHNDQLSFELFSQSECIFVDPGTFVYTPSPELRNLYRSTSMHNTLAIEGKEQNDWYNECIDDLFWLKKDKSKSMIIALENNSIIGEHYGFGKPHRRELHFEDNALKCTDMCEIESIKNVLFHLHPDCIIKDFNQKRVLIENKKVVIELNNLSDAAIEVSDYLYSPGYGIRINSKMISIKSSLNKISWNINFIS